MCADKGAAALLNPITWREPFGLVMVEALASATPVLAFPNGAAPEIVDQGRTGYLCRDEAQMITAVGRVPGIDRRLCRDAAERRFSLARMALDYQRLYRRILRDPGQLGRGSASGAAARLKARGLRSSARSGREGALLARFAGEAGDVGMPGRDLGPWSRRVRVWHGGISCG
jgi:hypothetical protein